MQKNARQNKKLQKMQKSATFLQKLQKNATLLQKKLQIKCKKFVNFINIKNCKANTQTKQTL